MRHRVYESPLPGWSEPAELARALFADRASAVWLDSGMHATEGMSYLGFGRRSLTASVAQGTVTIAGEATEGEVFDVLREDLALHELPPSTGFRLGWVGWLGYGLAAQTMGAASAHQSRYADASLLFVDVAIAFDHSSGSVTVLGLERAAVEELLATVLGLSKAPAAATGSGLPPEAEVVWADTDEDYLRMIGACQAAIEAGDAYQLCLTTEARVAVTPDPFETYLALRAANPSHHGAFFRAGEVSLLSSSPELFLSVAPDDTVESHPIKGTRRRGETEASDAALVAELLASDKERAENLMIVDLMRNDIARVSEVGSVSVPRLLAVETYAHVHQLVSTVRGRLAPGLSAVDAVVACFPAGSMTGAPKHSAVTILDRLEHRARGVYAGAFGYFGLDGRVELSMVIRSILLDAEGATVGSGGGITALSVPVEELAEVKLKAAALLAVLGVPSA
ncbi:MAG: anthranilate synthase component I family protein [Salinibacterium sp.]|nr:anthranilate synthase component I family protein [Salinibacterium sp.]